MPDSPTGRRAALASADSLDRLFERPERIDDRVDRIVDLVGDAGDQTAHRRQLLAAHQVVLSATELVHRLVQFCVSLFEGFRPSAYLAFQIDVDGFGRSQAIAQRASHLFKNHRKSADLVRFAPRRDGPRQLSLGHITRPLFQGPQRRYDVADHEHDDAQADGQCDGQHEAAA